MNTPSLPPNPMSFGYPYRTIRVGRCIGLKVSTRSVVVCVFMAVVGVLSAVVSLALGDYPLTLGQVVEAMGGQGDAFHQLIVMQWRLPVAIAALIFGALLGIGGAIFQSLTRNPLGSPDVIGFDAGSYTAVVVTILILGANEFWYIAIASLVGGLITALIVYVLSYRGGVQGFRLIIVGIGVSAMLGSINSYLITRADITDAMSVGFWAAGSLTRVRWESLVPGMIGGVIIFVGVTVLAPALRQLELGDDAALAQGVNAATARPLLLILGVSTTALVTAAAGPIGFVALAAPQLARRLTRSPGVTLMASALMGAAMVSLAQLLALVIAQVYRPIPVGLITVSLGGLYLIWLLIRETRRSV